MLLPAAVQPSASAQSGGFSNHDSSPTLVGFRTTLNLQDFDRLHIGFNHLHCTLVSRFRSTFNLGLRTYKKLGHCKNLGLHQNAKSGIRQKFGSTSEFLPALYYKFDPPVS
ncbi:hypothetical protein L6452_24554 [Arctium lappa]|uniref:Uncharacterized protein n=1 Tax=Arctium lappa TaxID=4217 RepID=A0ACB9AAU7_ARCLA|nr:hypothetical protein L6452_24554 [Arctium lappa]